MRALFVFAPLFAIAAGAMIAHESGISIRTFFPNIAAALAGLVLLFNSDSCAGFLRRNIRAISVASVTLLALTFFSPGAESVHRWIQLGPLSLCISMALTPIILFSLVWDRGAIPFILAIVWAALLAVQPDAGQATAFAVAAVVILTIERERKWEARLYGSFIVVAAAAYAWGQPDPIAPVDQVERIMHLAFRAGIPIFILSLAAVFALLLPIALAARANPDRQIRLLSAGFTGYLLTSFVVTQIGSFPVPVIGAGAAPALGWFFMAVLLSKS